MMSRQKSHSPTPLKILAPPGNHQSVSMETSEVVTENGNLLNGTTDHKRDVSWQNLLTSDGRVTYKEGNYFNHAIHTEEIIVREANCGSRPESPQKSFVDDIDPSLHPRLRTFSPTPGTGDSFNGNQRTHHNLDNTDSHYTNHNKIGLPDQTSSSKFQKAPDEDIVDLIMPSQECSQPKLILFEAPAALKKTVTMRRFGGASPDSVNNGKQRSTAPVVTDQRHGVVTRTGQSTFRRADTLPLKHPVNYSSSSAKREATARVSVKGQQLQLPPGVERNSRGDFTTLNINENRSVSPVQIIRTARHDENKLIEIVRKPGTEFQSRSPTQRSMRSPKPTYANPVDVYASVRRPKQLSPGTELKPNTFTEPEHVIQVNGARTDTEGIQSVRTSNYQQSPIRIQTPIDQFPGHNAERESMRPYFRSFNSSNLKPLRYAQSTPSSPVLGQSYYHRDHSMSPLGTRFSDTIDSVDGGVFKNDSRPPGLPPTPHRIGVGRNGRKDTPLTPTGPPVEHVSMCIDPVTGKPLRVTARSQSFTDLDHNVLVTETDEKIESEDQTEYRVKHQTIRKHRAGSPRDRRSSSQIERGQETIQQQQQFHNQTRDTDETVTEWRRHFKPPANAAPHRATSQVNIAGRTNLGRPQWQSDMNLRTSTSYKQTPMLSTYSAHRENLQRREEQRRNFEDGTSRQFSTRYFDESKTVGGGAEVMEEVETITLQPIGRGVHDLEPVGSIARSVRTNTPTGSYPLVPLQTRPHSSAGRLYHCAPKVGNPLRTGFTLTRSSSQSPLPLRPPNAVSSTIRSSFRETPVGVSAQRHTNARFASANGSPTFFRYDSSAMKSFTPRGSLPSPSNQMSVVGENKTGAVQVVTSSAQHMRSYQNQHQSPQQRPPTPLDRGITQQQDYSNSVVRRPSSPSLPAAPGVSTVPTRKQSLQSPSPIGFVSRAFTPAGFDQSDGYRTIATTNLHREVHTSGAPSPYPGTHHSPYYDSNTRSSEQRYRTMQHTGQQIRATTVPPNYSGNATGPIGGLVDGADWEHQELMKQAKNTFREWYLPDATREDVIYMLRDRDPGSFIIRNSISCVNSFSLGIKAPPYPPQAAATSDFLRSGQVKHFIIGTVPMYDGRGDGVQLCGFNDQPVFPALTDFVSHHCLHPGPLPCALRLPSSISASQQRLGGYDSITKYGVPAGGSGIMVDMLYLGCVPVDRLEKSAAIRKAISHILSLAATSVNGLPKRCEVTIHAKPTEGVKFTDRSKRNLVEKHLKPSQILFCGSDPEGRNYVDAGLRNRGFVHAKTFGILIRKKQLWMHENLVYVFSELDPNQSAVTLINYISHTFTS